MKIQAKEFSRRKDLEEYIKGKYGSTETSDAIEGTKEELRRLHLKHGSFVWGVRCTETDYKKNKKEKIKVPRGKVHQFGVQENPSIDIKNSIEN